MQGVLNQRNEKNFNDKRTNTNFSDWRILPDIMSCELCVHGEALRALPIYCAWPLLYR